jgi:hypothetical protein
MGIPMATRIAAGHLHINIAVDFLTSKWTIKKVDQILNFQVFYLIKQCWKNCGYCHRHTLFCGLGRWFHLPYNQIQITTLVLQ